MKLKKIALASLTTIGMIAAANAAPGGQGVVNFTGSIIDAPCSIAPESLDQTVNLGAVANAALKDGGKSSAQKFEIKLESCDTATMKDVAVTFTGAAANFDSAKTLGINGTARGAGIQIVQADNVIELGKPGTVQEINDGSNTLQYSAYLVGNGGDITTITAGEFTAVADFKLTYQ